MRKFLWLGLAISVIATLSACGGGGSSSTSPGAPIPGLTSIAVTTSAPTSGVTTGKTAQFTATGTFSNGTMKDITSAVAWTATTGATIGGSGLATGATIAAGAAAQTSTITATSGTLTGKSTLTVHNNLVSLAVTAPGSATTVTYGSPLQLSATGTYEVGTAAISGATWTSTASTVATVSTTGLVTAQLKSRGQAVMIQCAAGGLPAVSFSLTAAALVTQVGVSGPLTSLNVGSTENFTATATYNDTSTGDITQTATWSSGSTTIATISAPGVVLGAYGGSTVIMATMSNGTSNISGQANLTVNAVLNSIEITVGSGGSNMIQQTGSETFTATAIYNGAPNADVTASTTWASSMPNIVSIAQGTTPVTVTGVGTGGTNLTATYNSKSASYGLTVNPGLLSITVTPAGPGLGVGYTQQFKATANYTSPTPPADITATASWTSLNSTASIASGGLATGVSPGGATIVAGATGPNNQLITGTTAVDVVNGAPINLNGNYTFTLTSGDTRGPAYWAGEFLVSGGSTGTFTGVEDCNTLATGVQFINNLAGSYTTWPDGRGILTFQPNICHPSGVTYRFALAAINGTQWQKGRLAQFDGFGTAEGTIELQNSAAFNNAALSGSYAFKWTGIDTADQPLGYVGVLPLNGGGGIGPTAGLYDTNDFGTVTQAQTFNAIGNGAYSIDTTTGRGTLQIQSVIVGTTPTTLNFAVYVVDAGHVNLIETDTLPSLLGRLEIQSTGTSFTNTNLSGGYAFQVGRPVVVGSNPMEDKTEFGSVGQLTFTSGNSCATGTQLPGGAALSSVRDDANVTVGTNPFTNIFGCYLVSDATTGRTIFNTISPSEGPKGGPFRQYSMFPVSVNSGVIDRFFMLGTYTQYSNSNPEASLNAPIGEADIQATSFALGSLNGNYSLSASEITSSYNEGLLQLAFDGTGFTNGLIDFSTCTAGLQCTVSSTLVTDAAVSLPPGTVGRGAIVLPPALGFADFVFYLVDDTSAYILGTNSSQAASLGVLAQQ